MVNEQLKLAADASSLGVVGATLMGWLPEIAAGAVVVWTVVRTYTHIVDWRAARAQRRAENDLS